MTRASTLPRARLGDVESDFQAPHRESLVATVSITEEGVHVHHHPKSFALLPVLPEISVKGDSS